MQTARQNRVTDGLVTLLVVVTGGSLLAFSLGIDSIRDAVGDARPVLGVMTLLDFTRWFVPALVLTALGATATAWLLPGITALRRRGLLILALVLSFGTVMYLRTATREPLAEMLTPRRSVGE